MDYGRTKIYLEERGQAHLLKYYDGLTDEEKLQLLNDIEKTNFSVLKKLDKSIKKIGKITPVNAVTVDDIKRRRLQFENVGFNFLKEGKVAAVLLAGGQGSRLGYEGPKGTFDIGLTRKLSIFELLIGNLSAVAERAGRYIHLFVMTSVQNHGETVKFFKENNFFGYPQDLIHFFIQDVAPTCDFDGKVYLDRKHRVSLAANGNGGWYSSLVNSGLARVMERENIEWLNVFGVDNVLQKMCDPSFIGATVLKRFRCGAKVVSKVCPEEKVGVICNEDGKPTVLEYFEIPENLKNKTKKGELVYRFGVTLNYLFNVQDLNITLSGRLPYHLAEKAIPHMEDGERVTPK